MSVWSDEKLGSTRQQPDGRRRCETNQIGIIHAKKHKSFQSWIMVHIFRPKKEERTKKERLAMVWLNQFHIIHHYHRLFLVRIFFVPPSPFGEKRERSKWTPNFSSRKKCKKSLSKLFYLSQAGKRTGMSDSSSSRQAGQNSSVKNEGRRSITDGQTQQQPSSKSENSSARWKVEKKAALVEQGRVRS